METLSPSRETKENADARRDPSPPRGDEGDTEDRRDSSPPRGDEGDIEARRDPSTPREIEADAEAKKSPNVILKVEGAFPRQNAWNVASAGRSRVPSARARNCRGMTLERGLGLRGETTSYLPQKPSPARNTSFQMRPPKLETPRFKLMRKTSKNLS